MKINDFIQLENGQNPNTFYTRLRFYFMAFYWSWVIIYLRSYFTFHSTDKTQTSDSNIQFDEHPLSAIVLIITYKFQMYLSERTTQVVNLFWLMKAGYILRHPVEAKSFEIKTLELVTFCAKNEILILNKCFFLLLLFVPVHNAAIHLFASSPLLMALGYFKFFSFTFITILESETAMKPFSVSALILKKSERNISEFVYSTSRLKGAFLFCYCKMYTSK